MIYPSGNRDEAVFERPGRFDVAAQAEPARRVRRRAARTSAWAPMLARTQLRAIVGELLHRVPDLQLGEPDYLVSNFVHGVKSTALHRVGA